MTAFHALPSAPQLQHLATPARLAEALAEASHPQDFRRLCASPEGNGWRSVAELIEDQAVLNGWFEAAIARYKGRDEVAGSLLSLRLAGPIIDLAVSLFVLRGWAVPLPADGVMLAFSEHGAATAVALRDPIIVSARTLDALYEDDTAAPDDALCAYLAAQLAQILQPGFHALKAHTRYGLRGMWGQAADQIAGIAAHRARLLGLDQAATWRAAGALTDALAAVQPLVRMRPKPFVSCWPAGSATVAVKGSCCLYFKVSEQADTQRYCSNCPLLSDEQRRPRVGHLLEREYERLYLRMHRSSTGSQPMIA